MRLAISRVKTITWLVLAALSGLLCGFAARAATPAGGTITDTSKTATYTAGPFLVSNPSGFAVDPVCTSATCDEYALTVTLSSAYVTANPTDQVTISVKWPTTSNDFDLYVFDAAGNAVTQDAHSNDPEVVHLYPKAGTTLYRVRLVPFLVTGDSIAATITLGPPPITPPQPPQDAGIPPRFQNYAAPNGLATDAGEPSIGVNFQSGNVLFQAVLETLRVQFDDRTTPAIADWKDVQSQITSTTSLDPIMWTDSKNGRTFASQLVSALGRGFGCSLTAYTTDDGDSWIPSQGCGVPAGADHQTIGGGAYPSLPGVGVPTNPIYPNAIYYCSQEGVAASCARSDDGGLTFGPSVPMYHLLDCQGLHGHVKVGPDGVVYVPNAGCGTNSATAVSTDGGATWAVHRLPQSGTGASDPSVDVGAKGTAYFGYQHSDGHPHVSLSHDHGVSWESDQDVGVPFGIQNTVFSSVVAGDDDRAAFAFLGSTTSGDFQAADFAGVWHLYVAETFDGGQHWITVDATPSDPVQRGCIWMQGGSNQCRNLLDFMGVTADKVGRVLVGYADGCLGPCAEALPNTYSALGTIARQSGGRRLFKQYDPVEPALPAAPLLSGVRDDFGIHLSWPQTDDGGSALTESRVYRGSSSGTETLLTSVNGGKTAFTDASLSRSAPTPHYQITAVNARGEGPRSNEVLPGPATSTGKPDPCTSPGVTVVTDPTGDATGSSATQQVDVQSVSVGEPFTPDGSSKLAFTIKVASLAPTPQPNTSWKVLFIAPNGKNFFVEMNTYTPGSILVTSNVTEGPADSGAYNADGTIMILISSSKIGGPAAGQWIGGINAVTQILVGATKGLLAQTDSTSSGAYKLVGNAYCAPNNPPVAALVASPTSGAAPLTVAFDASASSDSDGDAIAAYTFDFGDGTVFVRQSSPSIGHTYASAGSYTASVVVEDARGKSSTTAATAAITATGAPTSKAAASGGGFLDTVGKVHFSFKVTGVNAGSVSYEDAYTSVAFDTTSVTSYSVSGKCASFGGNAMLKDGRGAVTYAITACDNGSPGRGLDTFQIVVKGAGASSQSGTISGGNITIK